MTKPPASPCPRRAGPASGILALIVAALAAAGVAVADVPADPKARSKASSFAPHHTKGRNYGAPVSRPILHKRKRHPPPAAPAEPIK